MAASWHGINQDGVFFLGIEEHGSVVAEFRTFGSFVDMEKRL